MDFEKFDKMVDLSKVKDDVKKTTTNTTEFVEVPCGKYEAKVHKLEMRESKSGNLQIMCVFKILTGQYKNNFTTEFVPVTSTNTDAIPFMIHSTKEFLKSLDSGVDVEFSNFKEMNDVVMNIMESIDGNLEYAIEIYESVSKGGQTYKHRKVVEVFEV